MSKLSKLVEIMGAESEYDMLEAAMMDSVCPSICMNKGCDYTDEMEPDQTNGWCPECKTKSVRSALSLAGVI